MSQELDRALAGEPERDGSLEIRRIRGRWQDQILLPDRDRPVRIVEPDQGSDDQALARRDALPRERGGLTAGVDGHVGYHVLWREAAGALGHYRRSELGRREHLDLRRPHRATGACAWRRRKGRC